jgi:hypothetical protein
MRGILLCWTAAGLFVAAAGGCHMCAHTYDDAGPTYTGPQCGPPPNGLVREGSVLNGAQCPARSPAENAVLPGNIQEFVQKYEQPAGTTQGTQQPTTPPAPQSSGWVPQTDSSAAR